MAMAWLETLKNAQKTSIVQDGRRKIHCTFSDHSELVEEYDVRTLELVVRKWKREGRLGGEGKWEFEVGELMQPAMQAEGLFESNLNPIFVRKDTNKEYVWRIRNLSYPLETYDVKVDDDSQQIIIRTSNKKYYKKFDIPDLKRCKLTPSQSQIKVAHANNTLIITYEKPKEILEMERTLQEEFKKVKTIKDGDAESCNQS